MQKQAESISLFLSEDLGEKKQQIPAVLTVEAALVIPLFLLGICTAWNNGSVPGAHCPETFSCIRARRSLVCQCGKRGFRVNTPTGVLSSGVASLTQKAHLPELGDGAASESDRIPI